ncbi:MAG: glycosyltransferase family 4 protein [Candidatus Methanoperedens sp.]|nr:glycosyltransferase family 4 protein [Candidatus Methanoperedens sp.]MCZ7370291.1 glycosyltransferase family 4 protein [Candidatus Methanoperedens sp.]
MNALHLTFRFGEKIVGGAEYLMYMISKKLVESGIHVDVFTTKTVSITPISRSGVHWDNKIKKAQSIHDGIEVYRHNTYSIPKLIAIGFDYLIQRQLDREELNIKIKEIIINEKSCLGTGWYSLENYNFFKMRWTKRYANFLVNDRNISKIFFNAYCPRSIKGNFLINGKFIDGFSTSKEWKRFEFDIDEEGIIVGKISLNASWHPLTDSRRLGIAINDIGYVSDGIEKSIDLTKDYVKVLRKNSKSFLELYKHKALKRPQIYNYLFMGLRGPLSPSLLYSLNKNAKKYDIILSQMMPFNTLNYGAYIGKKHGIPTVLLPLFHPDDSFYHWGHYYDAIKNVDMILALSEYTKTNVYDPLDVPCEVIGGGVDLNEFSNPEISGKRFKEKFKLNNTPIILFVGRKSYPKRYDLLIRAIDKLNSQGKRCRLVIIGPDEDKMPIPSKNVLYLGKVDRKMILDAYDACDIFSMMSESESFGIVYCEAWMRKKPVIGNKYCGPVSTLIEDGVDGFLCDENDLAEKISILLSDEKLRNNMGEKGYGKTVNRYTWDIIGNKVKRIYEELCK